MKTVEAYRKTLKILLKIEVALYIIQAVLLFWFPEPTPVHWNSAGEIDSYGSKWMYLGLDLIPLAIWLLFWLPAKRREAPEYIFTRAWKFFVVLFSALMMAVTWIPEYMIFVAAQMPQTGVQTVECVAQLLLGVLFLILGNFLPQVPCNRAFGAKTLWTKDNSANWQKTNHLCGILLFGAGILFVLAALFNSAWGRYAGAITLGITVVVYGYSFYQSRERR